MNVTALQFKRYLSPVTCIMRRRKRWLLGCLYLLIFLMILKIRKMILDSDRMPTFQINYDQGSAKDDASWLLKMKASRTYDIPAVIVEEHYEVLKYWFQAAELDLIQKSRNTLLHVDAHVDGAVPYDVDSIPWFRFPRNSNEVYRMMQRNDMFIVAAAVTGFFDHIIWVWPTWSEESHEDDDWSYIKVDVEIGIVHVKPTKSQRERKSFLCACWRVLDWGTEKSESDDWTCHIRNTTCFEGRDCPEISKAWCMTQSSVVLEIVSEIVAVSALAKVKWPLGKGFILDVDEDYFGTWSDAIPLYESGITQANIDVLSELTAYLFCVSTVSEEVLADGFYAAIVSLVKSFKSQSCATEDGTTEKNTRCLRSVEVENYFIENQDAIVSFVEAKQSSSILCKSEEKVDGLFFQSLLHFLLNFSLEQLSLLEKLGICLSVSPGSPNFPADGKMHVCHGDNIPNRTMIPFYLPKEQDIYFRSRQLKHILSSVKKVPDIITISRSVRDGYTPKLLFHLIERRLKNSINKSYRKFNISKIHYDSNLLGGIKGWVGRSQPWIPELMRYLRI